MGAVTSLLPAFQRAVTSNSAGTGVPEASTRARPPVPRTLRPRGSGTPERTTSPLRATPAVSRTSRRSWEGTDIVAADAGASNRPTRPTIRIARTREKRRREPCGNIDSSFETVHHLHNHPVEMKVPCARKWTYPRVGGDEPAGRVDPSATSLKVSGQLTAIYAVDPMRCKKV